MNDRLDSWKKIAAHFRRDVTTVQRWERRERMPVHRHVHAKQGSVYAFRSQLDAWWESRRGKLPDSGEGTPDPETGIDPAVRRAGFGRLTWRAFGLAASPRGGAVARLCGVQVGVPGTRNLAQSTRERDLDPAHGLAGYRAGGRDLTRRSLGVLRRGPRRPHGCVAHPDRQRQLPQPDPWRSQRARQSFDPHPGLRGRRHVCHRLDA